MNTHLSLPPEACSDTPSGCSESTGQAVRLHLMRHYASILQMLAGELLPEPNATAEQPGCSEPASMAAPERAEAAPDDGVRFDEAWEYLQTRSLSDEAVVALWLKSLYVIGVRLTLCVGVTLSGHRRILGLVACAPEDVARLQEFLQSLVTRGLCVDAGLLCIVASGTGMQGAVETTLGPRVAIQRCLSTKLRQVINGLPEASQAVFRSRLRQAWQLLDARRAETALLEIHADLQRVNRSAAHVLLEGLQETLTIQRTGLLLTVDRGLRVLHSVDTLGQKLQSCVPPGSVRQRLGRIALALLELEVGLRRMAFASYLPDLREALSSRLPS